MTTYQLPHYKVFQILFKVIGKIYSKYMCVFFTFKINYFQNQ